MKAANSVASGSGRLLSNSLWSIASIVFSGIVQVVSVPIVIYHVGAENYGLYVLGLTIGGLVALADLGLNEATIRFVAKYHAEQDLIGVNRVYGATLFVYCIVGLACSSAVIASAPWIIGFFQIDASRLGLATSVLRCAGITFLVTIWVGVLEAVPQAVLRYDVLSKARFLFIMCHTLGMIAVVSCGFDVLGLSIWLMSARVIYFCVMSVVSRRLIPTLRLLPTPSVRGLKEVFSYGVFSSLNALIARVAESMDRLVLGILFGPREVAYLSVPKQLLDFGASIHGAGGSVLFPLFSSMTGTLQQVRMVFLRSLSALGCLGLVVFVPTIVILPDFIRLWIGDEFAIKGATVAQLIAVSYALQAAFVVYFAFLKGTGRVYWLTAINATFGVLSPAITLGLILAFGFLGAGLRTLALVWVGYMLIGVILKRILGEPRPIAALTRFLLAPIATATLFCLAGLHCRSLVAIHGWFGLITAWSVLAAMLALILAGVTYVLQREASPTHLVLTRLLSLRRRPTFVETPSGG